MLTYEVVWASDGTMKLYFERRLRGGRKPARWWLFSIGGPEEIPRIPEGVIYYPI